MSGDQISLVKNVGTDQVAIQTSENSLMVLQAGQQGPPGPINAISGTGIVVQSALNTFVTRSVVAGSSGITVTNGDGVAGNVSLALAAVLVSIVAGTMNGVAIGGTTPAAGAFTTLSATGVASFASGTAAAPGIAFTVAPSSGFYRGASAGRVNATHAGTASASFGAGGIFAPSTGFFGFAASSDPDIGTGDTFLVRDTANTLALRNSTNAQVFRAYNTYTDSSNYERVEFGWTGNWGANTFEIATSSLGTGLARPMYIGTRGASTLSLVTSNAVKWSVSTAGAFYPGTDNANDIGSASFRPRDVWVGRSINIGTVTDSVSGFYVTGTPYTAATSVYGFRANHTATSAQTNAAYSFLSTPVVQNAVFTISNVMGFVVADASKGASATITTQTGVSIANLTTGATNYGLRSQVTVGANKWNLYIDGTAANYIKGTVSLGGTTVRTDIGLYQNNTTELTGTTIYGHAIDIQAQSGTTAAMHGLYIAPNTANAVFTLTNMYGIFISPSKGASATVTNAYGVLINDFTVAGTINAAMRSNVSVGSGKWNLYIDGTANNLFGGYVAIGVVTPAATLDIGMNATQGSWTTNGVGLRIRGNTYTDSSTAGSGTAVTNHIHAIAIPTLAATNATVTTTTAATLYIAGAPAAGTNMTITNAYAVLVNAGQVGIPDGSASLPSLARSGDKTSGLYFSGGALVYTASGFGRMILNGSNFIVRSDGSIGFSNNTDPVAGTQDVFLVRDAANVIAQRNSTNAQELRLYNTYTDGSNYERIRMLWNSNTAFYVTDAAGTGTGRNLVLGTHGAAGLVFIRVAGTDRLQVSSTNLLSQTDDAMVIGSSGANRFQSAYLSRSLVIQGPTGFVNGVTITAVATTVSPTIVAAGSDANITLTISSKGTGDLKLDPSTGDIQITKALVALGGGAAPTFGTIGGSGPATAAQNTWLRLKDSGGNAFWVPVWK